MKFDRGHHPSRCGRRHLIQARSCSASAGL